MRTIFGKIPFFRWLAAITTTGILPCFTLSAAEAPMRGKAGRTLAAASMVTSITPSTPIRVPRLAPTPPVQPPAAPATDRLSAVRQFIENGLSPLRLTIEQVQGSLLGWAIVQHQEQWVNGMLWAGVDPNARDFSGIPALVHAVMATDSRPAPGQVEMIETLVRNGAQVEIADAKGWRPLHYALALRKRGAVNALLTAQAKVSYPEIFPLAADTRDWTVIGPILERCDIRAWDTAARGLLEEAIRAKHLEHLRLLMAKHRGAPMLEGTKDPLLAYVVLRNDLELARLLLQAGADPNTTLTSKPEERLLQLVPYKILKHYVAEEPGMNMMSLAAGMGHADMLKLLLAHGAEKNRPTKSKYRLVPLYFAAWGNHVKCLQALIDKAPEPSEVRIEISLSGQQATLYKNGVPIFRAEISSGQPEKPTPTGQFVVTDKKRYHVSNLYEAKMPFFMRLSCKDFGMHEGHLPGYPASHGCIRLDGEAARKLFREVPIGTLVTIR